MEQTSPAGRQSHSSRQSENRRNASHSLGGESLDTELHLLWLQKYLNRSGHIPNRRRG